MATSDPMTPEHLAQIRAREAAATPGPWTWSPGRIDAPDNGDEHFSSEIVMWVGNIPGEYDNDDAAAALGSCGMRAEEDAAANLAFLAAARQDVPALLAEIDRLNDHLQVSLGVSEALAEHADCLEAERNRLRAVAVEMHAAFRHDVRPGYQAKQSYMVPVETIDRWYTEIWPPISSVLLPATPQRPAHD